jgi:hypothetical protein
VLLAALACGGLLLAGPAFAQTALVPRHAIVKPARTSVDVRKHDPRRLYVKFRDDLPVRASAGAITAQGRNALGSAAGLLGRLETSGARWEPLHSIAEARLAELRQNAQGRTGRAMPDLNTEFILSVPGGADAGQILDELNALDSVELAEPMLLPAPPPVVGNYEPLQDYLDPATTGIDAPYAWTLPGGTGTDVWIADIEYAWNLSHADLNASLIGPAGTANSQANIDHGTAVLGELGGRNDGVGVTGIVYNSTFYVAAATTSGGYNVAAAITVATSTLRAGDIIVLEQQIDGPGPATDEWVPIEWSIPAYNAIVTAVGNGIIVVEAAGNGAQNLDDPMFNTGHAPFLPANDSGAIIVGAGAPPGDWHGVRSRLDYSTYGSTVDLQGWGWQIVTTGYGDLHSSDGPNRTYTATFGGTSGATPIVAGACAALQGHHKSTGGGAVLSPDEIRDILRATGSPQLDGTYPATQNIGPLPNLRAAMPLVTEPRRWVQFSYFGSEFGTFYMPFNTLSEGVAFVPNFGTLNVKAGASNWTGSLTKPMTIRAFGGTVTLGAP